MKKIIASVIAMLATVSMVACGSQAESLDMNEGEITTTTSATTTTVTTTETVTTNNTTTSDVTTESVTEIVSETEVTEETEQSSAETMIAETEVTNATTETEVAVTERYIVYKPSTHYLHYNDCRWNTNDAYRVDCTTDLVARLCDECNPDASGFEEYVEQPVYCGSTDREYLAQIVQHEAGSEWIGIYNKACVVAVVMNRVNSGSFPNTVYGVLTQPYQFSGFWFGYYPSQACYDAVDYYFSHTSEFSSSIMYFYGDGYQNYFY